MGQVVHYGKNWRLFIELIHARTHKLIDHQSIDKEEVMAAAFFYQYLSQKDDDFLRRNDYTKEEVLFGFGSYKLFQIERLKISHILKVLPYHFLFCQWEHQRILITCDNNTERGLSGLKSIL